MKLKTLTIVACALTFSALTALGDKVIVTAKKNANEINDWPPYLEDSANGSFLDSSGNSKVAEDPVPTFGTRFGVAGYPAITVKPTLANAGGVYKIDVTLPTSSSIPNTIATKISATGCTLSTNLTLAMGGAQNAWNLVCYITNEVGVTEPEITLTYSDTLADGVTPQDGTSYSRRWYPAPLRFSAVGDPCLATPAPKGVNGPLIAGQTYVDVLGVASNATAVAVYADGVKIGTKATGVTEGVNRVTTSALVKDTKVVATQTISGQESCAPNATTFGPKVGGGANPAIYVSLVLDQNANLTGPVGASATPTLVQYHIPYFGLSGGYGTAPTGGYLLQPGGCWQTVTVTPGTDPSGTLMGSPSLPDGNPYAALAGIGFELGEAGDTGPFEIFIDNVMNGDTVLEDFESYTNGTPEVLFASPAYSGIIGADASASPRISEISTNNADTGTKSLRYFFQFADNLTTLWQRAVASGTNAAHPYPIVDLSKPISVRLLVLPVGETKNKLTLSSAPRSQTAYLGKELKLTVVPVGTAPYAYQWSKDGVDIASALTDSYTIPSVTAGDAGVYSVRVTDANCTILSPGATITVSDQPAPPGKIGVSVSGSQITLTWDGVYQLQSAAEASGPYTNITPAPTSPYTVNTTGTARFFRLTLP